MHASGPGEPAALLDDTKQRVLEAAGEEFAAHGFQGATIRAICRRAGANLAAVNYHYGDKDTLYIQALAEAHRCGVPDEPGHLDGATSGAEGLRQFVHEFLHRVLAVDRQKSWHHDLMLREMIRPSPASNSLIQNMIRPRFLRLRAIMRSLAPLADERRLDALCFSLIGQCLFYRTSQAIASRLVGARAWKSLDIAYLTDHITRVMLAAVEAPEMVESRS